MARLFPQIDPDQIENPGERRVAQALVSGLPDSIRVFHSFSWLGRTSSGRVLEAECDFVLLDPARGILFVEVKGGSLVYDDSNACWVRQLRSGEHRVLNKDPFVQVQRSMHGIVKLIDKHLAVRNKQGSFAYHFAAAFPDCALLGSLPPSVTREQVLDARSLEYPAKAIDRLFKQCLQKDRSPLSDDLLSQIQQALLPVFSLLPVTSLQVDDQEAQLVRLTEDQQHSMNFLGGRKLAAIEGAAGSGKTMLAIAKARSCAAAGMRTLLLCFNRPLADWLQRQFDASDDDVVVDTYHSVVDKLTRQAGLPFIDGVGERGRDFWVNQAPEALIQAAEILDDEHKFDSIVVDEGQDFHEIWWASIDSLFRLGDQDRSFYVFFDPRQNIYVDQAAIPAELGEAFVLQQNCRNTVSIARHCAGLLGAELLTKPGAPEGEAPESITTHSILAGMEAAIKKVKQWRQADVGNLRPSQIAILAPSSVEKQWLDRRLSRDLTRDVSEWHQDKGILLSSPGRFKGLEADAVIVLEHADQQSDPKSRAYSYVARSRAKHLLTVLELEGSG